MNYHLESLLEAGDSSPFWPGSIAAMAEAKAAAQIRGRPVKTALHQAVLDGRLHQVRLLVSKTGINVDSKDVFGRTPLMLACLVDNPEYGYKMVKIFQKAGAYANVRDNMNRTALSYACMKGRETIVNCLLRDDILDINCPDNDGNTPLCHAALSGHPTIVKSLVDLLVRFGLPVDHRNSLGYTPLLLACKYAHYTSAHILLTDGNASPNLRDNEFFLNAQDWVSRSEDLHESLVRQRGRDMPSLTRFNRENTLYASSSTRSTPVCRHFTPTPHPLGQSLDTALRLPAIFSYFPVENQSENVIDGMDAREVLIKCIDEVMSNPRLRPDSRISSVWTRRSYPATPKLASISARQPPKSLVVPDMGMLLKMYSDQYEARATRGSGSGLPLLKLNRHNTSLSVGELEASSLSGITHTDPEYKMMTNLKMCQVEVADSSDTSPLPE